MIDGDDGGGDDICISTYPLNIRTACTTTEVGVITRHGREIFSSRVHPTQMGWASGIVGPTADTGLLIVDKLHSLGSDS